jgi:hypothetical protein
MDERIKDASETMWKEVREKGNGRQWMISVFKEYPEEQKALTKVGGKSLAND